jgi:transcriptional regulator with XRE-family HTH domain
MQPLRVLRTSRSLTFLDLSRLTGIPARAIAEAEYGLRALSRDERERLAFVLGLRATELAAPQQPAGAFGTLPGMPAIMIAALAATLATAALQGEFPPLHLPGPHAQPAAPAPPALVLGAANAMARLAVGPAREAAQAVYQAALSSIVERAAAQREPIAPDLLIAPMPAQLAPQFQLTAAGPAGCPVRPTAGRVVITQGYGVGSHAPATLWGAVDLAVDGDGDGAADPGATWYAPVVASHAGVVRVDLNSYPAGNHVWVNDSTSPWRTGYSHLAMVTVISGQRVRAGEVIGLAGSTGEASGPHLDYQVWDGEVNVDPTALVGC